MTTMLAAIMDLGILWGYHSVMCEGLWLVYSTARRRHPQRIDALRHLLRSAAAIGRILIVQRLHRTVSRVSRTQCEIHFAYGCREYRVRLRLPVRATADDRPYPIQITDVDGKDRYNKILSYAGPAHDFFGIAYTPADLGEAALSILLSDGSSRSVAADEPIVLRGDA